MRVHILTIGDEILIGQIIDTNSAWMGQQLNLMGAEIEKITSVGDNYHDITENLNISQQQADVILVTGGLGPTKDDITKKAIADFLGVKMVFHEPTWTRIERFFNRLGRNTTPAHKEQCFMPEGAEILTNKMGTAPGMWFNHEGTVIVSMPGIPYEMKYLMENEVIPKLTQTFPGRPIAHRTILTVGEGESRIAQRLENFESSLPENLKLAYLPNLGKVRLRLTGRGDDQQLLEAVLDRKVIEIENLIPDLIFGKDKEDLASAIGKLLLERKLTLGTAESCTGGHIAHLITRIPGSSAYFQGSVVSYSNETKQRLLGVKPKTLESYGAVSEQTVLEMAEGAREPLGCDLAIAISGIAGPSGGSPQKPVGTIWMAVSDGKNHKTYKLQAGKDRLKNIQYASVVALNMIRKFLLD